MRDFGIELEEVIKQRVEARARVLAAEWLEEIKARIFGSEAATSPVVEELLAETPAVQPS